MTASRPEPPRAGSRAGSARGTPPILVPEELPELAFRVLAAHVKEHAASPTLAFELDVDAGDAAIRSLSLDVMVRLVATQRAYDDAEQASLFELFGAPRDWGRSLRTIMWSRATLVIPPFEGSVRTELPMPCSYDFDVAAHKYLHALRDGVIPLEFLFSGSVFYRGPEGDLRTVRLSWEQECRYDMPAGLWHDVMDRYFPNSAWFRVRRDVFDRLAAYRSARGLPTWEATLEDLLPPPGGEERP